jgi:hypothetical protein
MFMLRDWHLKGCGVVFMLTFGAFGFYFVIGQLVSSIIYPSLLNDLIVFLWVSTWVASGTVGAWFQLEGWKRCGFVVRREDTALVYLIWTWVSSSFLWLPTVPWLNTSSSEFAEIEIYLWTLPVFAVGFVVHTLIWLKVRWQTRRKQITSKLPDPLGTPTP